MDRGRSNFPWWLAGFAASGALSGVLMTVLLLVEHPSQPVQNAIGGALLLVACLPMLAMVTQAARHSRSYGLSIGGSALATIVFMPIICTASEIIDPGEFNMIAFMPVVLVFPGSLVWFGLAATGCIVVRLANWRYPRTVEMVCPKCGYPWRGLPTTICPECGQDRVSAEGFEGSRTS